LNKIILHKNILVGITLSIVLLILIFTFDVISETENWSFLNIDFKNKNNIVSAYGTLIGGILAFLSILFLLYGLLEQRKQILNEKEFREINKNLELQDKLKLLSSYLKSTTKTIIIQGEILKEFFTKEKESPSVMNTMYFNANENFNRILNMDSLSIYKAIRKNFADDKKWENLFLNIYSLIDFYSEGLKDLKLKYESHINSKFSEQKKVADRTNELLELSSELVDNYKNDFPDDYLKYDWVILANNFTNEYYAYLNECDKTKKPTNFRTVSDNLLLPLLENAMILRKEIGYKYSVSRKLVVEASIIRKKINEIEFQCIHYARDIEVQYNQYFNKENTHLNELLRIKEKIDNKIMRQH